MITKLTKHGSSWVLILDEPVLDFLKIDPETTALQISTNGDTLTIGRATEPLAIENVTATLDVNEPQSDADLC